VGELALLIWKRLFESERLETHHGSSLECEDAHLLKGGLLGEILEALEVPSSEVVLLLVLWAGANG
jgi:hypothetical protein